MEFRLFGEVQVWSAGRSLSVGTPRQQAVLVALLVDARRPVAIDTLVDRVWDGSPPADPRAVLYSHLSRIRRLLAQAATFSGEEEARIVRRHAGYMLDIDPDSVDVHRFRRLSEQGGDDEQRAAALAEALALWRGTPLGGVHGEWAARLRSGWSGRRLDAAVRWARIELDLGRPAAVVTTLPDLAAEYPLAEPLEALFMRALHATGRGAEALDRYTAVRRHLADELGTDPGPELRAVHRTLLEDEPLPSAPPRRAPALVSATAVPPPPPPPLPMPVRRRAPAVLVTLLAALVLQGDVTAPPAPQPVEHVQALFAAARKLHHDGKATEAQAKLADAARRYDDLLDLDPGRNGPLLAPAVVEALRWAGVDFSVAEASVWSWLASKESTPYPAISQVFLLRGWRLRAPVFLDVIVWNYEQAPGVTSPREAADVRIDVLEAAVIEGSNSRHGTHVREFGQLLEP
ncbi:AfsR/SARP family transcriptional regulator [Saccharothrix syringae]|uniref:OmpR/PhoB-type domain-containing protein n=1 Tax=Saccharothrix syringae TaxID=103733 RepID=A0A5Q0H444_SACSY|nr:BTAD domain-containing putative transcriptional regulator [Saccharothrix syringae]QFZ20685.1 hypothetical protein EKG83_27730 [Saccharothrix syringae]